MLLAGGLQEQIDSAGLGWFHARLFAMCASICLADGMEMTVLTMLREPVMREYNVDKYGFAALGSVVFGGMLCGSLLGGYLADRMGRRFAILVAASILCTFGLLSAVTISFYSFAAARGLVGLAVGMCVPVADSLLLEWSPTEWRSILTMTMVGIAFAIGSMLACATGLVLHQLMGEGTIWWRVLMATCALPSLISLPWMYIALPESPHYLMLNGRYDEAHTLLHDLVESNGTRSAVDTVDISKARNDQAMTGRSSTASTVFEEIFAPEVRDTTLYLMATFGVCGFLYYGISYIYPHVLEELYNTCLDTGFEQLFLMNAVEVGCICLFTWLMDLAWVGRRGAMLLAWAVAMLCCFLAIHTQHNQSAFQATNLLLKGMVGAAFTVIYVYAGELLPSTVRATVISFSSCLGRLATMAAFSVTTALLEIGVDWVYYVFAGVSGIALVSAFLHYRETLGQALCEQSSDLRPELERLQRLNWHDRYAISWKSSRQTEKTAVDHTIKYGAVQIVTEQKTNDVPA